MENKNKSKNSAQEDLKGFEDFMEGQNEDVGQLKVQKREGNFESYNFLENDSKRLNKIKNIMSQKIPFLSKYDQSSRLILEQKIEIEILKNKLNEIFQQQSSGYQKSIKEVFDSYFGPTKS
jgi:hypothetical protein